MLIPDLPFSHSMTVLIALGIVVALVVVVCLIASAVYKVRFLKLEQESQKSVTDGGDKTDMSDYFSELYKNDGSTGLRKDDLL